MLIDTLLEMVFPQDIYCICCGSLIDRSRRYSLCDDCVSRFGWVTEHTCEICGKQLAERNRERRLCYDCREREHAFDRGYTCSQYGLYERALVMDLKYRDKSYLARPLGQIMADRIDAEYDDGKYPWDIVTWVPVHRKRLEERGYDQAELMAKFFVSSLAGRRSLKLRGILERTARTKPMKDLGIAERAENVRGAFKVKNSMDVEGKSILVIDDIYVT